MEIVTNRKIIYNTDYSNACGCSGMDGYSNGNGDADKAKLGEKIKGAYGKTSEWLKANPEQAAQLKQIGGALVQRAIKGKTPPPSTGAAQPLTVTVSQPEPQGLSKNAKIGLAIGGVVALGLIVYLATKK